LPKKTAKKRRKEKKNYSRNRMRKTGVEVTDKLEKKRQ
jgi:hypothetical protein